MPQSRYCRLSSASEVIVLQNYSHMPHQFQRISRLLMLLSWESGKSRCQWNLAHIQRLYQHYFCQKCIFLLKYLCYCLSQCEHNSNISVNVHVLENSRASFPLGKQIHLDKTFILLYLRPHKKVIKQCNLFAMNCTSISEFINYCRTRKVLLLSNTCSQMQIYSTRK